MRNNLLVSLEVTQGTTLFIKDGVNSCQLEGVAVYDAPSALGAGGLTFNCERPICQISKPFIEQMKGYFESGDPINCSIIIQESKGVSLRFTEMMLTE